MFLKGDCVEIIDPFTEYFGKKTYVVEVCGMKRIYYHLAIDGESHDWKDTQLKPCAH